MKRRTRRRIVRTLITVLVMGVLVGAAGWHRWHQPEDASTVLALTRHDRQVASCEEQIRPRLQGEIDGWRLVDEEANAGGKQFTFAASVNDQTALYHCEVDALATVLNVDGPD
ncbi:hypothetical protein [Dyella sp. C11]|uniref:hypothetical protein n=1 Tax=Dyella sp. C11 TaxID=2126991 RepID=UPI00130092F3|nr:hypothetical protein [Dyella sp. C11]